MKRFIVVSGMLVALVALAGSITVSNPPSAVTGNLTVTGNVSAGDAGFNSIYVTGALNMQDAGQNIVYEPGSTNAAYFGVNHTLNGGSNCSTGRVELGISGQAYIAGRCADGFEELLFGLQDDGPINLTSFTDGSGTTGGQTINKTRFIAAFAATTSSITIINSVVTATSTVLCTLDTNDATAILKSVVASSGSVVISTTANTTGTTKVSCVVFN